VLLEREISLVTASYSVIRIMAYSRFNSIFWGGGRGFWWIDISTSVCKTLVTAFRAANNSLKDLGLLLLNRLLLQNTCLLWLQQLSQSYLIHNQGFLRTQYKNGWSSGRDMAWIKNYIFL
jgi:hypothetical protein